MKKKILIIITFFILNSNSFGQKSDVIYRVINIGNTVDIKNNEEYTLALKKLLTSSKDPVLLILNGDLIKKNKTKFLGIDSLKVFKMLQTLSSVQNAKIIVIPGDRDWNNSRKNGLKKVQQLENLVEYDGFKNVKWILDNGCPGPELIELDSTLLLMAINTQWWNHPHDKPTSVDGKCSISTKRDFIIEFENALAESEDKNLIIAGHFPLIEQASPSIKNYLLPVPIVGSFIASYHQNIGGTKDIINEKFNPIREKLLKRMSIKNGIIYLSGHERNTQIIKENDNYFINNGLPDQARKTTKIKNSIYTSTKPGITELIYYGNGDIVSNNYLYIDSSFKKNKELKLYKSLLDSSLIASDIPMNCANKNCLTEVSKILLPKNEDFIITSSGNYSSNLIKNLFMGKHYRDSWNQSIKVRILDMDTTKGGIDAYEKGGGHQTTSVKMYGNDGYAYTFRSVNKDATRTLEAKLKNSLIARFLQDNISKQHPYGGLIISELLNNTSILHAKSQLYILPNSNRLGNLNQYGGLLGTLEDHQKNPKKVKHSFANADKILQSHQLNKKLYDNHNHKINAMGYLKARVFDILVGDHGKHQDNWKWAGYKSDTGTFYLPIPRGRDLVFVKWDGLFTWIADRKWAFESGEHFGYKINDVKSLMWVARHPDRFLTNEMTKQDWLIASKYIQTQLTDSIIEMAAKSLPPEIYKLSGKEIEEKLKTRIKDLNKYALQYYKLLAKQVDVTGSNKKEYFEIIRNNDASIHVSIYNIKENSDTLKGDKLIYHRKFISTETKEIRLYGLGGKDVFHVSGTAKKSINIIIVGGDDTDIISDYSLVKQLGKQTKIYESDKLSKINLGTEAKSIHTWNKNLYHFQPSIFEFNRYLPLTSLSYNSDNGLRIGVGVILTQREKFGNVDYSAQHKFNLNVSTQKNNVFKYNSRFHHVIRKWDIQFGGLAANHFNFTNFFGIGNNTIQNDSLTNLDFYKTTYNSYSVNAGMVRDFWKKSSFSVNAELQHNTPQIGKNATALNDSETNPFIAFGTINNNIFISTTQLEINFTDRKNLPEKGIKINGELKHGTILNNNKSTYNIISGTAVHYFTAYIPIPITLGLKGGGSVSNGIIPFYNLTYLGSTDNLRGYKNNRFTGKSTAFFNTELRVQLLNVSSTFIPMKLGLRGFYDTGRVFSDYEISNKWHSGYGLGIYWVFLNENYTFNLSVARSEEENSLILFSFGKAFN